MDIPRYWAEASLRHKPEPRKQCTFQRFGWSSVSQDEARQHAQSRVEEALRRFLEGEHGVARREHTVPYNGAEGLPIREETVDEPLPNAVITRNSYGALCLNTPNVLFADIDLYAPGSTVGCLGCLGTIAGGAAAYWAAHSYGLRGFVLVLTTLGGFVLAPFVVAAALRTGALLKRLFRGTPAHAAVRRLEQWCDQNPQWQVRVYETPAGLRLLAMHQLFDPRGEEAVEFLKHMACDPMFLKMCTLQACFRARVSPKPWRAGVASHFNAGGTWPVTDPDKLELRRKWIEEYEKVAGGFASCRFLERIGRGRTHTEAEAVRAVHDRMCQADSSKPLA